MSETSTAVAQGQTRRGSRRIVSLIASAVAGYQSTFAGVADPFTLVNDAVEHLKSEDYALQKRRIACAQHATSVTSRAGSLYISP